VDPPSIVLRMQLVCLQSGSEIGPVVMMKPSPGRNRKGISHQSSYRRDKVNCAPAVFLKNSLATVVYPPGNLLSTARVNQASPAGIIDKQC
jgi:hypothetical protein